MSKQTKSGSAFARFFGIGAFTKVSEALTTEEFNAAETKLAAELEGKGEHQATTDAGAEGSGAGISPIAGEDPLKAVRDATAALGTETPPATIVPATGAVSGAVAITAEAFKAAQDRATKAEGQVTALTTERDAYKAFFDKHNALGKPLPGADATTTNQATERVTTHLSEASAFALEQFKARNGQ